jgi:hypothetical protein
VENPLFGLKGGSLSDENNCLLQRVNSLGHPCRCPHLSLLMRRQIFGAVFFFSAPTTETCQAPDMAVVWARTYLLISKRRFAVNRGIRVFIVFAVFILLLMGAASRLAADSPGASPESGIAPTCTYQPLAAGASVWLKIPYTFDNRLQFTLDAYGLDGVDFAVYDSPAAANPVGIGTYDANEPHDLNWEGQQLQNGFYYVLVSNSNPYSVPYNFCTNEKLPWHSFGQNPCVFENPFSPVCPPDSRYSCPGGWTWINFPSGNAKGPGVWTCTHRK